ncbi:hypothetical protein PYCC9005_003554 [Savitreella phatthalungensis]
MSFKSTTRPLRCTSLHQSSLPQDLGTELSGSLSKSLQQQESALASPLDSSDEDNSLSDSSDAQPATCLTPLRGSMGDASIQSGSKAADRRAEETRCDPLAAEAGRRRPTSRRTSSISQLSKRPKGLLFSSSTTFSAIDAIQESLRKRSSRSDACSEESISEARRAAVLAELPAAVEEIRRVSYRRTSMLPKPRSFTRVKETLQDESAPVETDARKEARLAAILRGKLGTDTDMASSGDDAPTTPESNRAGSQIGHLKKHESSDCATGQTVANGVPDEGHSIYVLGAYDNSDEMIFSMQELSPTTTDFGESASAQLAPAYSEVQNQQRYRGGVSTGKRKYSEIFEPYSAIKRRAVSPSIVSPLSSPPVKAGSIFRIEDLTL